MRQKKTYHLIIIVFVFIGSFCFGQTDRNAGFSCYDLTFKDSTDFLESSWIKEEIPENNLMSWGENHHFEIWNIDPEELRNDSITFSIFKQDQNSFLSRLESLKSQTTDKDKIYYYTTSKTDWQMLFGEEGLVLVRDCTVIKKLVIIRS